MHKRMNVPDHGDGRTDLAVADVDSNDVSILLGNGDGTFVTQGTYPVGTYPRSIVAGDFNGDGNLDLVETNGQVELGRGDGSFYAVTNYAGFLRARACVITPSFRELSPRLSKRFARRGWKG